MKYLVQNTQYGTTEEKLIRKIGKLAIVYLTREECYCVTIDHVDPNLRYSLIKGTQRFCIFVAKQVMSSNLVGITEFYSHDGFKDHVLKKETIAFIISLAKAYYDGNDKIVQYTKIPVKFL